MDNQINPEVKAIFDSYSPSIRSRLIQLRNLILETAAETDGVKHIEETLKWGEPAYLTNSGSTIRLDAKDHDASTVALYFHCQTSLVETFRALHGDRFNYDGNRAILFNTGEPLPADAVKQCVALALTYHKRKHLPLLGM